MFKWCLSLLVLCVSWTSYAQVLAPSLQHDQNTILERGLFQYEKAGHVALHGWLEQSILDTIAVLDGERWKKASHKRWIWRKLLNEHFVVVDTGKLNLVIDPLFNFQSGQDEVGGSGYTNTRGIRLQGTIGQKFGFYTSFWENQSFFPAYIDSFILDKGVVPGQGRIKPFKKDGYDYAMALGAFYYRPFKWLAFEAGQGQHFYGNGYRSLLLSDVGFNYPFLKAELGLFQQKLKYQPMFVYLQELQRLPTTNSTEAQFVRKAGQMHIINYAPNSRFEIGLFEGSIWRRWDSTGTVQLPANYYLPIPFLNTAINGTRNTGYKSILGLNARVNPWRKVSFYGQFALSDIRLAESGYQVGLKWYDVLTLNNLMLQLEYNSIPNEFYGHTEQYVSYNHYNQGIGMGSQNEMQEMIFRLNYNFRDVFIRSKLNIRYNTELFDLGTTETLELNATTTTSNVEIGYMLNHANRMMLLIGVQNRSSSQLDIDQTLKQINREFSSTWIYLSFRTDLKNLYFDF